MIFRLIDTSDGGVLAELTEGRRFLGSDAGCDICIHDESVSRRHGRSLEVAPEQATGKANPAASAALPEKREHLN